MSRRLRGFGRALGVGVAWAVAWAPVAVVIGIGVVDPDNSHDEMWPAIGAYPGFVSGVLFYALAGIFGGAGGLADVPIARAALLGAVAGVTVGLVPFAIGEPTTALPLWQLAGAFAGAVMLASALSAIGSVLASRTLRRRRLQRV